jgi:hypothetical protein
MSESNRGKLDDQEQQQESATAASAMSNCCPSLEQTKAPPTNTNSNSNLTSSTITIRSSTASSSPSSPASGAGRRQAGTVKCAHSNSYDLSADHHSSSCELDCRRKIYNQFKRSISYGGIERTIATSKSNFKKFSVSGQDCSFKDYFAGRDPAIGQSPESSAHHQDDDDRDIVVSDIIGSFGLFQVMVLLFSGLREGLVGYDALVMSIILQPDDDKCKWPLVCKHHWLMVIIESAYFLGLVTGNLTWGYCADKFGRRPAYLVAHMMSILFGSLAIFMPSVYLFAVCRFLTAFGCIGYNIIYSIQVELIGIRHRSFSTILNHLGWGLGVICVPLVDHLMDDYRTILCIAPILSLVM